MLAIAALSRSGARGPLARRLAELEAEVRELRRALAASGTRAEPPPEVVAGEDLARAASAPDAAPAGFAPAQGAASGAGGDWPAGAAAPDDGEPPMDTEPLAGAPGAPQPADGGAAPPAAGATPPAAGFGDGFGAIDWERWLGVRGAAVLGGIVFALAGLYFFRYSIEHGLIPPWLRVVIATAAGIGALGGAEWALRRSYAVTANALAGGGLVVLYAAFWAAGALYDLIGPGAVFVSMVAVTVAGCALSWRHESLVIAAIGLVGGFLTPLFAASGSDRPIGLFGYVLLLDLGLLFMARRRRWGILALLSFAGTAVWEILWIGGRMDGDRAVLGLVILGLFGVLFAFAGPRDPAESDARWRRAQAGGILLPLALAVYFAGNADLDVRLLPLGALLAVLGIASGWLARQHGEGLIALGAAGATVGVLGVWVVQHDALGGAPWTAAFVFALLAAASHVAVELAQEGPELVAAGRAAALVGVGGILLLDGVAVSDGAPLWPLLAAWLGIAGILARQGTFAGRGRVQVAAAVAVALGLGAFRAVDWGGTSLPDGAAPRAAALGVAVVWQAAALVQAKLRSRGWAEHAAAALAILLLLSRLADGTPSAVSGLLTPLCLAILVLLAATRLGGGPWMVAGVVAAAIVQLGWVMSHRPVAGPVALVLAFASPAALAAWPLAAAARLREDAWAWRAAALAAPLWLPAVGTLFEDRYGDGAIGLVPLALGAIATAAAARAQALWPADDARRTSALAWLCGAALALVTAAIPLQLEKEWITIGWALEGAALIALWRRLDHPGLKYTALALLIAVTVRLVANESVLEYYPRSHWRIFNWLAYTYLVPASALAWSARQLHGDEVARLRPWEREMLLVEQPLGAGLTGFAALVVVFVWMNLAIADWFGSGTELALFGERMQARDLTTSISWALYALALLALGVRLASGALRWLSLGLLMVTIAKIFLYDLGELGDLYRVASLLGLAVSLLVVSVVYQRFVLRRGNEGAP